MNLYRKTLMIQINTIYSGISNCVSKIEYIINVNVFYLLMNFNIMSKEACFSS